MPKQIFTSKYFCKQVMDESLNDFQEIKTKCVGPKLDKIQKQHSKPKRRIKGQKDIRTLIKSKKNELLTFTEDFNNVCTKSGIDIDSQELQLAIALSKSLQEQSQAEPGTSQITKPLSSQERTNQIRRTLQEYGFRVPEAKIKSDANRRLKKFKKPFKLLLISEEERRQRIFDKYTQVLFQNPDKCYKSENDNIVINKGLIYLCTNITYDLLKSNSLYFIPDILQEISVNKGGLLRDWSDIPGRPCSPTLIKDHPITLSDIECTQGELDTILSGTLIAARDILNIKKSSVYKTTEIRTGKLQSDNHSQVRNNSLLNTDAENLEILKETKDKCVYKNIKTREEIQATMFSLPQQNRSMSPDIFGDDASSLIDNSIVNNYPNTGKQNPPKIISDNTLILDLNKSTIETNDKIVTKPVHLLSESSNRTKRRTNDFMDLTECVPVSSQKYKTNPLSQSTKAYETEVIHNDCMEITDCINPPSQECNTLDSDDIIPTSIVKSRKDLEIINNSNNLTSFDLTQSSNSDEDLPIVEICRTQKSSSCETIIVDFDDYVNDLNNDETIEVDKKLNTNKEDTIILIQENNTKSSMPGFSQHMTASNEEDIINLDEIVDNKSSKHQLETSDIDLTQSSGSSADISATGTFNQSQNSPCPDYCNLGKKGDVSIDYDEICPDMAANEYYPDEQFDDIQSKYIKDSSNGTLLSKNPIESSKTDLISNGSNTSEVFVLPDKELNYSLCKYNVENFQLGGISIMDSISNLTENRHNSIRKTKRSLNRSLSDSCLPSLSNIDKERTLITDRPVEKYIKVNKSVYSSPIKAVISDDKVSVQTPTNGDYFIKVGEVTPMLDYASMSSSEMNKELEKYGLKPFKRKRAIQLLTHLYNQTHPIIEHCSEQLIPAKKLKLSSPKKTIKSPTRSSSPRKSKRPLNIGLGKENEICYEETKDVPDIKEIECSSDDWVFQKREKAKVHSCRVPLHIAFHNYVSCRHGLREAILRYEPVNIDVIHKDLVSYGYRYNPKDLLRFLDKKCITVKTADNNARNCRK